jgi:starch phosphorylase
MSNRNPASYPDSQLIPADIEGFSSLAVLALDMRWSWNHAADELWRQLDPNLWAMTHNPWVVLQTAPRDRIAQMLADPRFQEKCGWIGRSQSTGSKSASVACAQASDAPLTCASGDTALYGVAVPLELDRIV